MVLCATADGGEHFRTLVKWSLCLSSEASTHLNLARILCLFHVLWKRTEESCDVCIIANA
jgi:hypothetical protein